MREIITWMLVVLTLVLVGWFWVRPSLAPNSMIERATILKSQVLESPNARVDKSIEKETKESPHPPPSPMSLTKYDRLKQEMKDWGGILGSFSPLITAVLVVVVKRGKKKKKK